MLETSFGLFFFLKQSKSSNKDSERYVYARITVDGISKEISTKRIWDPSRWNSKLGKATGPKEDSKTLNSYLDLFREQIFSAKSTLIRENRKVSAQGIKEVVTGKDGLQKLLLEIFKQHNKQMEQLVGKDFSPLTLKRYKTTFDHTQKFIKWKYNTSDIDIRDLDFDFANDFALWLKTIRTCGHNSTMKYISTLKKITNLCLKKKLILFDPFVDFKTAQKEVKIVPLNPTELKVLTLKKFSFERLALVRDIFVFSCYTGLAYVDVSQLKRTDIITGEDGEKWITTSRQKTDSPTRLPLLPTAVMIMEKYDQHPKCKDGNFVLPVLSNQKMNAYLKEIADLCNINKRLTYHIARHTFATTVTLSNHVPIETVSKMMGHKSLKQTQHYAKIVDAKVSEDMNRLKKTLFPSE